MEMQMDWSYVGAVVISGLVIVFVALILLIIAVWVMGKIFTSLKNGKDEGGEKAVEKKTPVVTEAPAVPAPAPVVMEEDDSEIIAVIAAAVAAMSEECGQPLRISSIKRSAPVRTRSNAWARAAQSESTRAF